MTTIRIMTYCIQGCRGGDGNVDPERILNVISKAAPDIVALQDVDSSPDQAQTHFLANRLGMRCYGGHIPGGNAFLSYYPLRGVQEYDLGEGGVCLRGDADVQGKRFHLFNLRLSPSPLRRRRQIANLLGPDLLASPSLGCPLLVIGDFADAFWGAGNLHLSLGLRKARRPLWSATYPSRFPMAGRDRAYTRGDLKVLDSAVSRSALARQASSHLPLILTVQVNDPRCYLRLEKISHSRMEIAPG